MENEKRMFQILDEMNLHDIENGTRFVTLHPDIIEMNHTKKGTKITMGVPDGIVNINDQLTKRKKRIVLMVVDGDEFDKRNQ